MVRFNTLIRPYSDGDYHMKDFFEKQNFWQILTPEERNMILENTVMDKMEKNRQITVSAGGCPGLIWLKKGRFRAYVSDEDGKEITLFKMDSGQLCVLSASCILKGIHFDMTLSAMEDSEIYILPQTYVYQLVENNMRLYLELQNEVLERFSDVIYLLTDVLGKRMTVRVTEELLDLADENDQIHATHEELALYLNSAREVVSRTLKYLEKEGYIESRRGVISLKDKIGLRNLLS